MNEEQKAAMEAILIDVSQLRIYIYTAMKEIEAIWPKATA